MTMYVGLTMFWSLLARNLASVDFGQTQWFWSIFIKKTGVWPKKMGLVDLGRKNWFPDRKTVCGQFWPERVVSGQFWLKKLGFNRKNWLWSILAGKSGFGWCWLKNWFWAILTEQTGFDRKKCWFSSKQLVLVDFDWKSWFVIEKNWVLTEKNSISVEKLFWIDFDWKNWFWSILTGKTGFGRFWPQCSQVVAHLSTNWAWLGLKSDGFRCIPGSLFFRPGFLSAKGCPRPKGPKNPVFCDFLPLGV